MLPFFYLGIQCKKASKELEDLSNKVNNSMNIEELKKFHDELLKLNDKYFGILIHEFIRMKAQIDTKIEVLEKINNQ
jgi:hypothetical protein